MTDTNFDLNAITLKLNNILIIAILQLTIIFSRLYQPATLNPLFGYHINLRQILSGDFDVHKRHFVKRQ